MLPSHATSALLDHSLPTLVVLLAHLVLQNLLRPQRDQSHAVHAHRMLTPLMAHLVRCAQQALSVLVIILYRQSQVITVDPHCTSSVSLKTIALAAHATLGTLALFAPYALKIMED